jgi:assimilatory nitrate reductase electron transfer subunit
VSRVVVVGNGMAGCRFVQELLDRDPDRRLAITVVGEEAGSAYNRVLLSDVLAGTTHPDAITLADARWYAERGVTLHAGRSVSALDRGTRAVTLDDGQRLGYDVLVLATGSAPALPPIAGLVRSDGSLPRGAALFRTESDCAAIDTWAASARRAVVVGAGVLGVEVARALAGRGLAVTVVQRSDRPMERQLDVAAGRILGRTLGALGIDVRTGAGVTAVQGTDAVTGVTLSEGRELPADLLVLCCGVQPRVELMRAAGLHVERGVVVDDRLRTSDENIVAIGECAEHRGRVYGLVAPVWEQARVAATIVADPGAAARYTGSSTVVRLKARGIELAALGEHAHADDDDEAELVTFLDRGRGVYQKLVVRDGRLVAAILLGDTRNAGAVTQLFERGVPLPPDRATLLMARRNAGVQTVDSPTALPGRATICHCNGVTKAAITAAYEAGARSVEEIAARTRATTGCGTCRDAVCGLAEWLAASA